MSQQFDLGNVIGSQGNTGIQGRSLNPRGEWNVNTTYYFTVEKQDWVSHQGSSYAVLQTNTGIQPSNTQYYQLLAQAGAGAGITIAQDFVAPSPNAVPSQSLVASELNNRVRQWTIQGEGDWINTMIPLVNLSNSNINADNGCSIRMFTKRFNGVHPQSDITITAQKHYNSEDIEWNATSLSLNYYLKPSIFTYNGTKYFGVRRESPPMNYTIYVSGIVHNGYNDPNILTSIPYYNTNTDETINLEIKNSITDATGAMDFQTYGGASFNGGTHIAGRVDADSDIRSYGGALQLNKFSINSYIEHDKDGFLTYMTNAPQGHFFGGSSGALRFEGSINAYRNGNLPIITEIGEVYDRGERVYSANNPPPPPLLFQYVCRYVEGSGNSRTWVQFSFMSNVTMSTSVEIRSYLNDKGVFMGSGTNGLGNNALPATGHRPNYVSVMAVGFNTEGMIIYTSDGINPVTVVNPAFTIQRIPMQ